MKESDLTANNDWGEAAGNEISKILVNGKDHGLKIKLHVYRWTLDKLYVNKTKMTYVSRFNYKILITLNSCRFVLRNSYNFCRFGLCLLSCLYI